LFPYREKYSYNTALCSRKTWISSTVLPSLASYLISNSLHFYRNIVISAIRNANIFSGWYNARNERRRKICSRNDTFMNFVTSRRESWSLIGVKLEKVGENKTGSSVFCAVVDKSYPDVRYFNLNVINLIVHTYM